MARDRSPQSGECDGGDVGERAGMVPAAYLRRIGVDPTTVDRPDLATLARLQRAHVLSVPFENLAIVGDPHGDGAGEGVELSVPHLYEKVVERNLGGYCFELNGLFHELLAALGYDVDRVAARVTADEGTNPPANHLVNVVDLDRRYVVDVGTGTPMIRQPLPLDGAERTDDLGVAWRVAASDRPDEDYAAQVHESGDTEWAQRYVFSDVPRELQYLAATNDHLQSAPESTFTGAPIVAVATAAGHRRLSADTLTETDGSGRSERSVSPDEWHETLTEAFGIRYDWAERRE